MQIIKDWELLIFIDLWTKRYILGRFWAISFSDSWGLCPYPLISPSLHIWGSWTWSHRPRLHLPAIWLFHGIINAILFAFVKGSVDGISLPGWLYYFTPHFLSILEAFLIICDWSHLSALHMPPGSRFSSCGDCWTCQVILLTHIYGLCLHGLLGGLRLCGTLCVSRSRGWLLTRIGPAWSFSLTTLATASEDDLFCRLKAVIFDLTWPLWLSMDSLLKYSSDLLSVNLHLSNACTLSNPQISGDFIDLWLCLFRQRNALPQMLRPRGAIPLNILGILRVLGILSIRTILSGISTWLCLIYELSFFCISILKRFLNLYGNCPPRLIWSLYHQTAFEAQQILLIFFIVLWFNCSTDVATRSNLTWIIDSFLFLQETSGWLFVLRNLTVGRLCTLFWFFYNNSVIFRTFNPWTLHKLIFLCIALVAINICINHLAYTGGLRSFSKMLSWRCCRSQI